MIVHLEIWMCVCHVRENRVMDFLCCRYDLWKMERIGLLKRKYISGHFRRLENVYNDLKEKTIRLLYKYIEIFWSYCQNIRIMMMITFLFEQTRLTFKWKHKLLIKYLTYLINNHMLWCSEVLNDCRVWCVTDKWHHIYTIKR